MSWLPFRSFSAASDHFLVGANLPWVIYGCDFGRNAWFPHGGLATNNTLSLADEAFRRLVRHGVRCVRWFTLCDGRSGVLYSDDGSPLGLDDSFFSDLDAAVSLARRHEVTLLLTLLDFCWLSRGRTINGVQTGGRRESIRYPKTRQRLLDRVIAPILARYREEPSIAAWDIMNEPEWATLGIGTSNHAYSVTPSEMREFIGLAVDLVHAHTRHEATVGSASAGWLDLVRGLGLDFYQPHWYDHLEKLAAIRLHLANLQLDRPAVLGELPTRNSCKSVEELLETARAAGYRGAFLWSVLANDAASDYAGAEAALARWMPRTDLSV